MADNKKTAKEPPLPRETFIEHQPWLPHRKAGLLTLRQELMDAEKDASRYKKPQGLYEKLTLLLQKEIIGLTGAEGMPSYQNLRSPTPRHWRPVIDYLYQKGLIFYPDVQYDSPFNDEPKLYKLALRASSAKELTDGTEHPSDGFYCNGVSHDLEEALSKVIGELLERYSLSLYRDQDLIRASVRDLKKTKARFLNPFLADIFSEEQKKKFPKRRFDEESIFRWVEGQSLTVGERALIPAQMAFWNYKHAAEEPVIYCPITNGAGGMFTLEEAILSGLYELIQRDAFFVFWFNKIAPPRIDQTSITNPEVRGLLADIQRYNLETEILNITSDLGVPSFLAIIIDRSGHGPAVSVGGGCGFNPVAAIRRALTEALGGRHWLRGRGPLYPSLPESYQPFSSALFIPERLLIWGNEKSISAIDFFLHGPHMSLEEICKGEIKKETPKKELWILVESFAKRGEGYEIFYYEAKHPALKELGYHSVRVSVPALTPLYLNETCAPLGAERIKKACYLLGYTPAERVNQLPHPFP